MKTKHKSQDRKASPQPSPSSTTEPGKIETIFFSWQSDAPRPVNRSFIDSCLERAMKKVNELPDLKSANRSLVLDHSTLGEPGTPAITDTILAKIDGCFAFVADLTLVGKTKKIAKKAARREMPNPNVMLEYGWALKSITHRRIVGVMNHAFGKASETSIPFDLRHRRWPIDYDLSEDATTEEKDKVRAALVGALVRALTDILKFDAMLARAPHETDAPGSPGTTEERTVATRRDRDISVLTWVLEQIHLGTLDRFAQRAAEANQVIWSIFNYWESFDGAVSSSYFHLYDQKALSLIQNFRDCFGKALGFGEWFVESNNLLVFSFMPEHLASSPADWRKAERDFRAAVGGTMTAWSELLAYLRNEYPEIDIEATSQKAIESNRQFKARIDDSLGGGESTESL